MDELIKELNNAWEQAKNRWDYDNGDIKGMLASTEFMKQISNMDLSFVVNTFYAGCEHCDCSDCRLNIHLSDNNIYCNCYHILLIVVMRWLMSTLDK